MAVFDDAVQCLALKCSRGFNNVLELMDCTELYLIFESFLTF